MSTLDHPNVVKMYQVMTTKSKVLIVMELVTGGELYHEILRHKRLSEDSARHYYRQLIDGLYHCHSHGVYHRDLKVRSGRSGCMGSLCDSLCCFRRGGLLCEPVVY